MNAGEPEAETHELGEQHRSLATLTGHRWRERLRDKAAKLGKPQTKVSPPRQENDLIDFLRPSSAQSSSSSQLHAAPRPFIDTSPATLKVSSAHSQTSLTIPTQPPRPTPKPRSKKPKGLHVSFKDEEPEIIGEGGDESETPSKDVRTTAGPGVKSLGPTKKSAARRRGESPPSLPQLEFLNVGPQDGSRRVSIQRAPTRKPVGGWEQKRLSMNMEEGLVKVHKDDVEAKSPREDTIMPYAPSHDQAPIDPFTDDTSMPRESQEEVRSESSDIEHKPPSISGSFVPYNPSVPTAAPTSSKVPQNLSFSARKEREIMNHGLKKSAPEPNETYRPNAVLSSPSDTKSFDSRPSTADSSQERLPMPKPPSIIEGESNEGFAESEDFYSRVQHLRGVFRLAAEKSDDVQNKAAEHWLRVSTWWFLRGKQVLEGNVRASMQRQNGSRQQDPTNMPQQSLQCYVNLAKAWWIVEDIIPDHMHPHSQASRYNTLDSIDGLDYSQLVDVHRTLTHAMKGLAIFMSRKDLLPPHALLVQGADPSIWIDYPSLPPGLLTLTAGLDPRTLTRRSKNNFFPILLNDTPRHFSYGRVFGDAEIVGEDSTPNEDALPCVLSIIRERNNPQAEVTITSQDGQANIHIQSDPRAGPTWDAVQWKIKAHSIRIRLSRDFEVSIRLWDQDFKTLWGIHDYINRVGRDWKPKENEKLLFDDVVNPFHYVAPQGEPTSFPSGPIKQCSVRLFERRTVRPEGSVARRLYDGYRLVVVTPPTTKTLSSVSRVFGKGAPIMFSNLRGEANAPATLLVFRESGKKTSMICTFQETNSRTQLQALFSGFAVDNGEVKSHEIPLESLSIVNLANGPDARQDLKLSASARWQSVKVINEGPDLEGAPILHSDHLRVCSVCNYGTVIDLINLGKNPCHVSRNELTRSNPVGTGELRISLDIGNSSAIKLYRPPQDSLIVAFADNLLPKDDVPLLEQAFRMTANAPSARAYKFPSLAGEFCQRYPSNHVS